MMDRIDFQWGKICEKVPSKNDILIRQGSAAEHLQICCQTEWLDHDSASATVRFDFTTDLHSAEILARKNKMTNHNSVNSYAWNEARVSFKLKPDLVFYFLFYAKKNQELTCLGKKVDWNLRQYFFGPKCVNA